jgi:hypothetical protein
MDIQVYGYPGINMDILVQWHLMSGNYEYPGTNWILRYNEVQKLRMSLWSGERMLPPW